MCFTEFITYPFRQTYKKKIFIPKKTFLSANAIGFGLALITFAGLREHLDLVKVPPAMRGVPAAFVAAGLMALAFMGFAGIV
jgi:Na+-translocating ferredoxin:NAD+ oxidoreductase RnfA subunit